MRGRDLGEEGQQNRCAIITGGGRETETGEETVVEKANRK